MRRLVALALAALAVAPGVAAAADPPDPGQTTSGTVTTNGAQYPYRLYTPTSYAPGHAVPLLVMVHGCETTAEQQQRANLFDPLAEREGFLVLYPDVDAIGRLQPGPANQCWKFPYPPAWVRGGSDAAAIADMTRAAMAQRAIDPERVYLIGMSAGGLMASIEAAAYPDLYAAIGISAAAAYADWGCLGSGTGLPVALSAQLAFAQMGPRARVVPRFVISGDADTAFPPPCTAKALEQGLRTDNLAIDGRQDAPLALTPANVRQERKPGGYSYTVSTYRDPAGCVVGERWLIHGMNHYWPGGTTDPTYAAFTDPRGPSGAEASWAFFKRFRRSDTAMPCAESPVAPVTCPARTVTVTLPPGTHARSASATVDRRHVRARLRGRRVRVSLPSGPKGAVRVVLRVRREGRARAQTLRRTFARC